MSDRAVSAVMDAIDYLLATMDQALDRAITVAEATTDPAGTAGD